MLLGITKRLVYVDAPSHIEDLKRYRARGYAMKGNRIAIVTDHPKDLVEVHPPSRGSVDLGGVTVERCPPVPVMGWEKQRDAACFQEANPGGHAAPLRPSGATFLWLPVLAGGRRSFRGRDGRPRPR